MRVVTAAEIDRTLDFPGLIAAILSAFRDATTAPPRHHHRIVRPRTEATLLLMPAWQQGADGGFIGVKLVTVFPDNATRSLPSVLGTYMLMAGESGAPLAAMDGVSLTLWRTAATSALVSNALARPDASHLVMIGAGALAPYLIRAHAAVRPITHVTIWNRTATTAARLATALARPGLTVAATTDRETAIRAADIVSVATLSTEPLVEGAWLKPGTHVDLVGAFRPTMREADDATVRWSTVYVDSRAGMNESGDIAQPLESGALTEGAVVGELSDIVKPTFAGRRSADEITLFKSVGHAAEDLAAAVEVWRRLSA
jgi:ornithine cyclodeaminase/alanine dehydrogenase-like protein (mu-crystallin family)